VDCSHFSNNQFPQDFATLKVTRAGSFSPIGVAVANFASGSEPLLKRKGTIVYTKEGTGVKALKTRGMNKTGDRRKMFYN
jgi:hypothetical protein